MIPIEVRRDRRGWGRHPRPMRIATYRPYAAFLGALPLLDRRGRVRTFESRGAALTAARIEAARHRDRAEAEAMDACRAGLFDWGPGEFLDPAELGD